MITNALFHSNIYITPLLVAALYYVAYVGMLFMEKNIRILMGGICLFPVIIIKI